MLRNNVIGTIVSGLAIIALAMLALPFIANESNGTIIPSVEYLLSNSHIVVLASVSEVDNPGAAKRAITLNVKKALWPNFSLGQINSITLLYEKIGRGNIDFERMKSSGNETIFCLRYVPDEWGHLTSAHIEMTDSWFGSLPADSSTLVKIQNWVASK